MSSVSYEEAAFAEKAAFNPQSFPVSDYIEPIYVAPMDLS